MLKFACLVPHPPIILPKVGSPTDRAKVKKTIASMESLSKRLAEAKPDCLMITSPHPDWGFNVPLHFLTQEIRGIEIKTHLTDASSPEIHFNRGKELIKNLNYIKSLAWIASGDMSHRLKEDGPYGLHPAGAKYDKQLIELLKKKDIPGILHLDDNLVEKAAECGLRSFCFLLGALAGAKLDWEPEILSYEAPFGVGYLVANLRIK